MSGDRNKRAKTKESMITSRLPGLITEWKGKPLTRWRKKEEQHFL